MHRYYLQSEILSFLIALHRPWFLRQPRSDKYAASRATMARAVCDIVAIVSINVKEHVLPVFLLTFSQRGQFRKNNRDLLETNAKALATEFVGVGTHFIY
jgi:hypothetical protein